MKPSNLTLDPALSFCAHFAKTAEKQRDKTALISVNSDRQVSYGKLDDLARRICASLSGRPSSARVICVIDDKISTAAALIGTHYAGHIFIPVDGRDHSTIAPLMATVSPHVLLVQSSAIGQDDLDKLAKDYPDCQMLDIDTALSSEPDVAPVSNALSEGAVMLFTSGTTSNRKAVLLSHRAFAAPIHTINRAMDYTGDEVEYICGNFDHAFALGRLRTILPIGATAVFDEGPLMPPKILSAMRAQPVNALSSPASGVLLLLSKHSDAFAEFNQQIKIIKMASQAVPLSAKKQLVSLFPNSRIYLNYGLSEAQRTTLISLHIDHDNLHSSGRALPGYDVVIRNPETRAILPANETGVISIKGANVMEGYWGNSDKTKAAFHDGWLVTDDLGQLTSDGYLVVEGRLDETINSGGEKYAPEDIELRLKDGLKDHTFCICAMADPAGILGEIPALCVEQGDSKEPQKWTEWPAIRIGLLKQRIKDVPKHAFELAKLPRTSTGKIQRKKITQMLNGLANGK